MSDNLLTPGPNGTYPNWPRDENGAPVQPTDESGKPIRYARGVTGELYAIRATGAYCRDHGRSTTIAIPTLEVQD